MVYSNSLLRDWDQCYVCSLVFCIVSRTRCLYWDVPSPKDDAPACRTTSFTTTSRPSRCSMARSSYAERCTGEAYTAQPFTWPAPFRGGARGWCGVAQCSLDLLSRWQGCAFRIDVQPLGMSRREWPSRGLCCVGNVEGAKRIPETFSA